MIQQRAYQRMRAVVINEVNMKQIYPQYYHAFSCLASACPDSCCKEWAVQVDEASAERYRTLPTELGRDLRRVMVEEDGETILALTPDRRCPMWQQDGLCRIHAQMGEDALCDTCREFPRLRHDYGDFVELGLELSCPEAARLILAERTHLAVTEEIPGGDIPDYDADAMEILLRSRGEILDFLNDSAYSVNEALAVLLLYGYSVQNELDGGEPAVLDPEFSLAEAHRLATSSSVVPLLEFFRGLEILKPIWSTRLTQPNPDPWTEEHRALARYFILRYWLQTVSDYDLVCRVKLAVISCLVIQSLGGNLSETAQLYSKEIENNVDNIEALLDGAYTSPALADRSLLGLLLIK